MVDSWAMFLVRRLSLKSSSPRVLDMIVGSCAASTSFEDVLLVCHFCSFQGMSKFQDFNDSLARVEKSRAGKRGGYKTRLARMFGNIGLDYAAPPTDTTQERR